MGRLASRTQSLWKCSAVSLNGEGECVVKCEIAREATAVARMRSSARTPEQPGAMADVYLATDVAKRRDFALRDWSLFLARALGNVGAFPIDLGVRVAPRISEPEWFGLGDIRGMLLPARDDIDRACAIGVQIADPLPDSTSRRTDCAACDSFLTATTNESGAEPLEAVDFESEVVDRAPPGYPRPARSLVRTSRTPRRRQAKPQ